MRLKHFKTKKIIWFFFSGVFLFFGPAISLINQNLSGNLVNAQSKNIVKNSIKDNQTSIQVYAARTWGLKGALAVHTWITTKRNNANHFINYQIIGWRYRYGNRSPLVMTQSMHPIQNWYGNPATLLVNLNGNQYESIIDKIENAITQYPYRNTYTLWPGPNSNTFTAYIAREVPELTLDLPSTAIGKDYRPLSNAIGISPSGSGIQANIFGLLGFTIALEEGFELNLLSLNFELDLFDAAFELPGLGRFGKNQIPQVVFTENH